MSLSSSFEDKTEADLSTRLSVVYLEREIPRAAGISPEV